MPRIAVLILTKNEEVNIEECIKSASFADEIVVIDSGSTDATQAKAEALGARFVVHPMDDGGFAGQRNFALTQTEAEWVFFLDADERIVTGAVKQITEIVAADIPIAYRVQRKNVIMGKMMQYGGHRPDYVARFYPRQAVKWHGRVHEGIETELSVKDLPGCLHHYTYTTWHQYFSKSNQYTSLSSQTMFANKKKVSRMGVLSHAFFAFLKSYVLKQGFRDGYLGFVMSILAANASMTKYLKLRNLYRLAKEQQK